MLIFGVSIDNILAGLENAEIVSEKIGEIMKVKMDPVPDFQLEIHRQSGKEFIILRVASGQETPYYYVGDGTISHMYASVMRVFPLTVSR